VSPGSRTVAAAGDAFEVRVSAASGCEWTAESRADWLTVVSGSRGSGSGDVAIRAEPNTSPERRKSSVLVAGTTVEVTQHETVSRSVSIEGEISRLSGRCPNLAFVIDGPVDRAVALAKTNVVTGSETRFVGRRCSELENHQKVRLSGSMDSGRVMATVVVSEDD
jgi:hypothetical protein